MPHTLKKKCYPNYLLLNKLFSRCQLQFPLLLSSSQLLLCTECAEPDFVSSSKLQTHTYTFSYIYTSMHAHTNSPTAISLWCKFTNHTYNVKSWCYTACIMLCAKENIVRTPWAYRSKPAINSFEIDCVSSDLKSVDQYSSEYHNKCIIT